MGELENLTSTLEEIVKDAKVNAGFIPLTKADKQYIRDVCNTLQANPYQVLAMVMSDLTQRPDLRVKAAHALAGYLFIEDKDDTKKDTPPIIMNF